MLSSGVHVAGRAATPEKRPRPFLGLADFDLWSEQYSSRGVLPVPDGVDQRVPVSLCCKDDNTFLISI